MSDTPRTDAFEVVDGVRYVMQPRSGFPDMTAFARQLERELSALEAKRKADVRKIVATCEYIGRDWKDAGMREHVYATDYLVGHIRAEFPDCFTGDDNESR